MGRLVADRGPGVRVDREVNTHLSEKFALTVEHLNATIAAIRHVNIPLRIESDAVWSIELARLVTGFSPRLQPIAILVNLRNSGIDITIADVSVACSIPG